MTAPHRIARHDDSGAVLIMAIVVMLVIGMLSASLVATVTTGLSGRASLDKLRNREYAADGAIDFAITQVRQLGAPGAGIAPCGPGNTYAGPVQTDGHGLDDTAIRVDCTNVPVLTRTGLRERNVAFSACDTPAVACTDATTIIRAQVNFATASSSPSAAIVHAYVESWSVNR